MNPESHKQVGGHPSRLVNPLMQSNAFRARLDERMPLPPFAAVRDHVPEPVLPGHPQWLAAYNAAWATVWDGISQPPSSSPLGEAVVAGSLPGSVRLDESAVVARLAGYALSAYDLIHLLDSFYRAQLEDGFIPREMDVRSGEACYLPFDPNSTGPNLLAWSEWRHFRLTGDETRLREVFAPLAAYHRWLRLHRTWPDGLYWSTGYASGDVDQTCVPDATYHHRHWSWLDATLQANISGLLLGRMAELLEDNELAEEFSAERSALGRRINTAMWDEDTGFYYATNPEGGFSERRSLTAYWALLDRQLVPEERRKRLVQALRDEYNQRRKSDAGALATADGSGNGDDTNLKEPMAATPLTTYVALRGLQAAGSCPLAHDIAVSLLSTERSPARGSASSSALTILTILEQVVGLAIDWPLRQVSWRNYLGHVAETGVRRVTLGQDGTADLLAADGVLAVRTDAPFTLTYRDREQEFQSAVPAGISTFDLR